MAIAASRPIIATTIIISTSVKPPFFYSSIFHGILSVVYGVNNCQEWVFKIKNW